MSRGEPGAGQALSDPHLLCSPSLFIPTSRLNMEGSPPRYALRSAAARVNAGLALDKSPRSSRSEDFFSDEGEDSQPIVVSQGLERIFANAAREAEQEAPLQVNDSPVEAPLQVNDSPVSRMRRGRFGVTNEEAAGYDCPMCHSHFDTRAALKTHLHRNSHRCYASCGAHRDALTDQGLCQCSKCDRWYTSGIGIASHNKVCVVDPPLQPDNHGAHGDHSGHGTRDLDLLPRYASSESSHQEWCNTG